MTFSFHLIQNKFGPLQHTLITGRNLIIQSQHPMLPRPVVIVRGGCFTLKTGTLQGQLLSVLLFPLVILLN